MPVAYAAIGASGAPDLVRFPPEDSTPYEYALQLGSGSERFLTAVNLLMTWGAQRAAGLEVADIELGETTDYTGVHFTEAGVPELGADPEELFTPEGDAYIRPGTTAALVGKAAEPRRIMVLSTVVEQRRLGFTWGDRDRVPGYGEQQLFVEHRGDGTVWAVARGFAFLTSTGLMAGKKQRAELKAVGELANAFLEGLAPGAAIRTGVAKPADAAAAPAAPEVTAAAPEQDPAAAPADAAGTTEVTDAADAQDSAATHDSADRPRED